MTVQLRPYDNLSAHAVLTRLDPADRAEAALIRGGEADGLDLFADWRAGAAFWIGSRVAVSSPVRGAVPFAVVAVTRAIAPGIAHAALLARDHGRFRRDLVELARLLAAELPGWAARERLTRIEARSWAGHPRAAGLLMAVGFCAECVMPGFGPAGRDSLIQWAWTRAAAEE